MHQTYWSTFLLNSRSDFHYPILESHNSHWCYKTQYYCTILHHNHWSSEFLLHPFSPIFQCPFHYCLLALVKKSPTIPSRKHGQKMHSQVWLSNSVLTYLNPWAFWLLPHCYSKEAPTSSSHLLYTVVISKLQESSFQIIFMIVLQLPTGTYKPDPEIHLAVSWLLLMGKNYTFQFRR